MTNDNGKYDYNFNAIIDTAPSVRERKGFEIQTGTSVYSSHTHFSLKEHHMVWLGGKESLVDWWQTLFSNDMMFFAVLVFSPGFCLKESQGPLCWKIGALWALKGGKATWVPWLEWRKSSVIYLPSMSSRQVQILAACVLKVFVRKCEFARVNLFTLFASRRIVQVTIFLLAS